MSLKTKLRCKFEAARKLELGVIDISNWRRTAPTAKSTLVTEGGVMTLVLSMDKFFFDWVAPLKEKLTQTPRMAFCCAIELADEHLVIWQCFSEAPIRNAGSFLKNVALKRIDNILTEIEEEQEDACEVCGDKSGTCDCNDPNFIEDGMYMSGLDEDDPQDCAEYYDSDDPADWDDGDD